MRVLANSYVDVSLAKPKGECIEAVLYSTNSQILQKSVHEDIRFLFTDID
jgi:hypothetical protein